MVVFKQQQQQQKLSASKTKIIRNQSQMCEEVIMSLFEATALLFIKKNSLFCLLFIIKKENF